MGRAKRLIHPGKTLSFIRRSFDILLLYQLTFNRYIPMIKVLGRVIICILVCCITSCKQKTEISPKLLAVKETVLQLDSISVNLHGWEPKDSTYVPFDDSALETLIERQQHSHPMYDSLDVASVHPSQEQYDNANEAWSTFKRLCTDDHYEEALANFYDAHNDLILFLKHSTLRYKFYKSVVLPLMIEYEGVESAIGKYIAYLELQQSQAEVSIALGEIQGNNYVPEVYPYILMDLAEGYVMTGDLERGMGLISSIISSFNILTKDIIFANFQGVSTGAKLQQMTGDIESAIYIWEDFKRFLSEYSELADSAEELAYYGDLADEYIKQLRDLE